MKADIYADGAATRLEGPLLFLKRTVNVGLNEAVEVEDVQRPLREIAQVLQARADQGQSQEQEAAA